MHTRIIVNPAAGRGEGLRAAQHLKNAFHVRGIECELIQTKQAGDAATAAACPGTDVVVAVGGDGSVNEVVNGLLGNEALLAILPLGTANVLASELNVPQKPEDLADLLCSGTFRKLDVGKVNGHTFVMGVGAGFDAAIVEEVHAHRPMRMSYAAYVWPVLRAAGWYGFPPMHVVADGQTICENGQYVVIGNCRWSAGLFCFTPEARTDDGFLDVCIFRNLNAFRMAYLAAISYLDGFAQRKDILYLKAQHIELLPVESTRIPYQMDGDPGGELPVSVTIEPEAVHVVAPPP